MLSARKIREGGKRAVLKDVNVATGDEIYEKIKDAEKMTNEKKRKKSVSKSVQSRKRPPPVVESSSDESEDMSEAGARLVYDCITVADD